MAGRESTPYNRPGGPIVPGAGTDAVIERRLRESLAPLHLEVRDDSGLHAGHPGARGGGGHYSVVVVAAAFEGMERVERHRLVYSLLVDQMQGAIHALALRALTPAEWDGPPA
jgi:BolA protein